jgi:hypothetical protein
VTHRYALASRPEYRRAVSRLLAAVHGINRKPLRGDAGDFDGVM